MVITHSSGLFSYYGTKVIFTVQPISVKSYSLLRSNGDVLMNKPTCEEYNFTPYAQVLVVELQNGNHRMFRLNSKDMFEEVTFLYTSNESDLEGEDVLLYHLGLLDLKYRIY